jgi:hypothetical protein
VFNDLGLCGTYADVIKCMGQETRSKDNRERYVVKGAKLPKISRGDFVENGETDAMS